MLSKVLVLVVDSMNSGIVCMQCHSELIALRRDRIATYDGHEPLAVRREREEEGTQVVGPRKPFIYSRVMRVLPEG